jgi:hypothetical protein
MHEFDKFQNRSSCLAVADALLCGRLAVVTWCTMPINVIKCSFSIVRSGPCIQMRMRDAEIKVNRVFNRRYISY